MIPLMQAARTSAGPDTMVIGAHTAGSTMEFFNSISSDIR